MKKENMEEIKNEAKENGTENVAQFKEEILKDENKIKELILKEILYKTNKLLQNKNNNFSEKENSNKENTIETIIEYYNAIISRIHSNTDIINDNQVNKESIIEHTQEDNWLNMFYELFLRQDRSKLDIDCVKIYEQIVEKYWINKNQLILKDVIKKYINNNKWEFHQLKNELPYYKEWNNLYFNRYWNTDNIILKDMYVSDWLVYLLNQEYIIENWENLINMEWTIKSEFWSYFNLSPNLIISQALEILSNNLSVDITQTDLKIHLVSYIKTSFINEYKTNEWIKLLERFAKHKKTWEKIFKDNWLPEYCAFLPITESRVDPSRVSSQWAWWYFWFIPQTAKKYNLKVSWRIDERMDPIKSAQAAANLLNDEKKYRYNIILYKNNKDKISKTQEYVIQKWDNIPKIAWMFNTNWEVILDYNPTIIHNKLNIWDIILIPIEYNISKAEIEKIDSDSFFLALASYNWFIAKQLDVKSYDEYLEKTSKIISLINKNKTKLNEIADKLKKWISENEYYESLNFCIEVYEKLTNEYPWKYKESIFQNRLNSLKKLQKSKKVNRTALLWILIQWKNLEIVNRYNNILLQNLIYPANLIASRDAYLETNLSKVKKL